MKKLWVFLIIAVCSLGLVGCSQEKPATEPAKSITIGIMPDVESIPFIIAEKNGYFAQQGVEAEIVPFKSAKDRDSALQSGQLDGVITDIVAVVFYNEGGMNLKICSKNDGDIKLMAGKDTGIASINDIKGKSIGISSNTIMEYTVDKMLAAGQISTAEVNKIAIPQLPTRLEMLQGGKVDAAILPDPMADLAVQNGAVVLASTDAMANKAGAIAFTDQCLQENMAEMKGIFRAYDEAIEYLATEPASSYINFVIEAQGFPEEVKDTIKLPQYSQAALPDEEIFNDVVDWMQGKQLIKGNYLYEELVVDQVLR